MSQQREEVVRLRERYVAALGDPRWSSNIHILRAALSDRTLGVLPGNEILLYPPREES